MAKPSHNTAQMQELPPPEAVKKVETAIGAARAETSRDDLIMRKR